MKNYLVTISVNEEIQSQSLIPSGDLEFFHSYLKLREFISPNLSPVDSLFSTFGNIKPEIFKLKNIKVSIIESPKTEGSYIGHVIGKIITSLDSKLFK